MQAASEARRLEQTHISTWLWSFSSILENKIKNATEESSTYNRNFPNGL